MFILNIITLLFISGCTRNEFIVIDNRLEESNADIDNSSLKNQIYFYSRIIDFSSRSSTGYSAFQKDNIAQVFIFVTHGSCILYNNNYFKAYEDGVLSPISGNVIDLTTGKYDFYFVSTNSSTKPPTFSNGIATNSTNNKLNNGIDYLWYYVTTNITQNPTVLPVEFKHCATQIVVNVSTEDTNVDAKWIGYASIESPVINDKSQWNLNTSILSPCTSLDSSTPLQLNSSGLTSHQIIFPLDSISEIPMYITIRSEERRVGKEC